MALFAAMTLVGLQSGQIPFSHLINAIFGTRIHHFGWNMPTLLAIPVTIAVMVLFAWLVERLVLKHLVNQEPIILFMATIGLAYFLEGFGDLMWGAEVKRLDVGIPQGMSVAVDDLTFGWFGYGFYLDTLDLWALGIATVLVAGLVIFAQYTKEGRALRAVADDHQAALSVGISLRFIWVLTWSIAGIVALVAGIMWGSKSGVQFSVSLIALKALPVLMRDIGRGGIGFVCDRELPVHTTWHVAFLQHNYQIGSIAVAIKHCRQVRPGVHLVGGQFIINSGMLVMLGVGATLLTVNSNVLVRTPP
jgi:branched-chain amino acid transport system permease protein